jgi:hypothetical protein
MLADILTYQTLPRKSWVTGSQLVLLGIQGASSSNKFFAPMVIDDDVTVPISGSVEVWLASTVVKLSLSGL